jgi:hypothetical protein
VQRRRKRNVKQIVELGQKISNLLNNVYDSDGNTQAIREINTDLDDLARKVSGIRADELANEDMENSPIVRLFWTTRSELTAKALMEAAQQQSYYQEADK